MKTTFVILSAYFLGCLIAYLLSKNSLTKSHPSEDDKTLTTLSILFALTSWFTVLLLLVELANTKFLTQKN